MKRIRVFVDHANFDCGWKDAMRKSGMRFAWDKFPAVLVSHLAEAGYVREAEADLRGITVYASLHPKPSAMDVAFERWLKTGLDQMPGYTVKYSYRQEQNGRCKEGHPTKDFVEKGVDTKIVCDMMALAMRDLYDLGVIVSDDSDLVPSVECVQDVLDRQIVHVGFKNSGMMIRSAAWSHLLLDQMADELKEPRPLRAVN
ncbi:MAG TPA: NYN domain-containing protein [Allosphingosinicella sp.]|jgi:hypothetical protein